MQNLNTYLFALATHHYLPLYLLLSPFNSLFITPHISITFRLPRHVRRGTSNVPCPRRLYNTSEAPRKDKQYL